MSQALINYMEVYPEWIQKGILNYYSSLTKNPNFINVKDNSFFPTFKEKFLAKFLNLFQNKYIWSEENYCKVENLINVKHDMPLLVWKYLITEKDSRNNYLLSMLIHGFDPHVCDIIQNEKLLGNTLLSEVIEDIYHTHNNYYKHNPYLVNNTEKLNMDYNIILEKLSKNNIYIIDSDKTVEQYIHIIDNNIWHNCYYQLDKIPHSILYNYLHKCVHSLEHKFIIQYFLLNNLINKIQSFDKYNPKGNEIEQYYINDLHYFIKQIPSLGKYDYYFVNRLLMLSSEVHIGDYARHIEVLICEAFSSLNKNSKTAVVNNVYTLNYIESLGKLIGYNLDINERIYSNYDSRPELMKVYDNEVVGLNLINNETVNWQEYCYKILTETNFDIVICNKKGENILHLINGTITFNTNLVNILLEKLKKLPKEKLQYLLAQYDIENETPIMRAIKNLDYELIALLEDLMEENTWRIIEGTNGEYSSPLHYLWIFEMRSKSIINLNKKALQKVYTEGEHILIQLNKIRENWESQRMSFKLAEKINKNISLVGAKDKRKKLRKKI